MSIFFDSVNNFVIIIISIKTIVTPVVTPQTRHYKQLEYYQKLKAKTRAPPPPPIRKRANLSGLALFYV